MRPTLTTSLAGVLLVLCAAAAAAAPVTLPRAGQVGITLQGGYGTLIDTEGVGAEYGHGGSLAIRLRYRMRYERAIALSFESNRFDARVIRPFDPDAPDSTTFGDRLGVTLSGVELYQMFGTRTPNVRMASIGIGLVQQRVKLNSGETELSGEHSGDGLYLSAGFGIERFFYRSFALDLSARYYAMFREGKTGHNVQVAIGVIGYAGY